MQRTVLLTSLVAVVSLAFGCGQSSQPTEGQADEPERIISFGGITEGEQIRQTVEVGCAKCMYKMEDMDSHELAIMLDGKAWEATGAVIDPTEHGLCDAVKKAKVVGKVLLYGEGLTVDGGDGEFVVESIELQE